MLTHTRMNLRAFNKEWLNITRSFTTGTNVLLKQAGPNKKTSAFTKRSGPVDLSKRAISLEEVKPVDWSLHQATPVLLPEMTLDNSVDKNINVVFSLPSIAKDKLKGSLLPKALFKEFAFVRENGLLFRNSSLELINKIDEFKDKPASLPIILDGKVGSGKSSHLLQVITHAILTKEWIIIYSPNSIRWVNGSNSYNFDANTKEFYHPDLTKEFLSDMITINKDIFEKIKLETDVKEGHIKFNKGTSLIKVLLEGIRDINSSNNCMKIMFSVLNSQKNYPVLIAIDEINNFTGKTAYFDNQSCMITPEQFSFIKEILSYFKGTKKLNKGVAIGANSWIDMKYSGSEFGSHKNKPSKEKFANSISKNGIKFTTYPINPYDLSESEAVAKYYKEAYVSFGDFSLKEVTRKFMVSNGNPREFFRANVCSI